jgi:hypothetical protein
MKVVTANRFTDLAGPESFEFTPYPAKWSHTFGENGEFRIAVANDFESRRVAYELVYKLYREKGYADPNQSRMWLSVYNLLPDTTTLVVLKGEEMVGTLTVVFDSPLGLPGDTLYKREIDLLRESGRRPAEIVSLGVADEDRHASRDILVKLFNYAYLASRFIRKHTDFVITVNPHHALYYQKTLLFEEWGRERSYEKVGGAPAVLLRVRLDTPDRVGEPRARNLRQRTHYRFFHTTDEEWEIVPALRKTMEPMSEEEFCFFAMGETDVWNHASIRQKEYLAGFYFTALLGLEGDRGVFANAPSAVPGRAISIAVA